MKARVRSIEALKVADADINEIGGKHLDKAELFLTKQGEPLIIFENGDTYIHRWPDLLKIAMEETGRDTSRLAEAKEVFAEDLYS